MANVVKLKRSAVSGNVPSTSQLELGEVALNTFDGDLFFKKDNGTESIVSVVTTDGTQTLTNKTLTSPTISNPTLTGTYAFNSDATTTPAMTLTANSLNDGVGALRIDGAQADIFLNPSTATHTTVTFAVNDDQRLAFGMDNNSDFYITRRTGGTWYDDTLVIDRDTGEVAVGYDLSIGGDLDLTGSVDFGSAVSFGGAAGSTGQVLISAGSGSSPTWGDFALDDLTDVSVSGATTQQVLKFNGTSWVAGDVDVAVASAIFAPQAQSDLGFVNEASSSLTDEDLGLVTETTVFIYDMGRFTLDGIVSLSNIDQSVKADYIGYAIIFGF